MTDHETALDPRSYSSFAGVDLLLLHVAEDGHILYVNTAFCEYFVLDKESILNTHSRILLKAGKPKLARAIQTMLEAKRSLEKEVEDEAGRVFRVLATWKDEGAFITIDDVSRETILKSYVNRYVLRDFESLSEADLSTFRFPERRFMTVSFADLRDFTALSEKMNPRDVRATLNAYLDGMTRAVVENNATIDKIVGDGVMVLYGAPCYYKDHALRAVKTALDQQQSLKQIREQMAKQDKFLPECGIAISTGEMVVGNIGTEHRQDYTVVGANVNLASRICDGAEGGQVLLTEPTFLEIVDNLPKGWQARMGKAGTPESAQARESVIPLDSQHQGAFCTIGPPERPAYRLRYLYATQYKGINRPIPVLEATLLGESQDALSDETIEKQSEKLFGKYSLQERIGKGRSSEVWKAMDEFGNRVALKILQTRGEEEIVRRFEREAQIMRNLDHPNICRILEFGIYEKKHYIAMEYLEGIHLRKWFEQKHESNAHGKLGRPAKILSGEGPLKAGAGAKRASDVMAQVLAGLDHAHAKGIIHRDLKPENIMIKPNCTAVIMDFGLGRFESAKQSATLGGEFLGSIDFMSPEQARGAVLATQKADIFSAGAILFFLLTGKRWYKGTGNILADTTQIAEQDIPRVRSFQRKIPRKLDAIVAEAMHPDPGLRYASASEFRKALLEITERPPKGRSLKALALGALAALIVVLPLLVKERIEEYASWGAPLVKETYASESWQNDWSIPAGGFVRQNQRLVSNSKLRTGNAALYKKRIPIPVAFEFDVSLPSRFRLPMVSAIWVAEPSFQPRSLVPRYELRIGTTISGYASISKFNGPLEGTISIQGHEGPVERNKPYRVRVEIESDLVSLFRDGELVAAFYDPFPISSGYAGLLALGQGISFDNVKLYSRNPAEKVSVLGIGMAFQRKGFYEAAIEEYDRIARSRPESEIAHAALLQKSICLIMMKRTDSAEVVLDGIQQGPMSEKARFLKSDLLRNRGKHKDAANLIRKAFVEGNKRQRVRASTKLQNWLNIQPQLVYVRTAQNLLPDDTLMALSIGNALGKLGYAHEVLETYPHFPLLCANALNDLGRHEEVLEKYPEIRIQCVEALYKMSAHKRVIEEYRDFPEFCVGSLYHTGQYRRVLNEYPAFESWNAMSLVQLGQGEEALRKFQGNPAVCALILFEMGRFQEILDHYPGETAIASRARAMLASHGRK